MFLFLLLQSKEILPPLFFHGMKLRTTDGWLGFRVPCIDTNPSKGEAAHLMLSSVRIYVEFLYAGFSLTFPVYIERVQEHHWSLGWSCLCSGKIEKDKVQSISSSSVVQNRTPCASTWACRLGRGAWFWCPAQTSLPLLTSVESLWEGNLRVLVRN